MLILDCCKFILQITVFLWYITKNLGQIRLKLYTSVRVDCSYHCYKQCSVCSPTNVIFIAPLSTYSIVISSVDLIILELAK